ncbi:MAG: hypothetical protein V1926_04330 [Candidatus Peregrinibacteria bacterium]
MQTSLVQGFPSLQSGGTQVLGGTEEETGQLEPYPKQTLMEDEANEDKETLEELDGQR